MRDSGSVKSGERKNILLIGNDIKDLDDLLSSARQEFDVISIEYDDEEPETYESVLTEIPFDLVLASDGVDITRLDGLLVKSRAAHRMLVSGDNDYSTLCDRVVDVLCLSEPDEPVDELSGLDLDEDSMDNIDPATVYRVLNRHLERIRGGSRNEFSTALTTIDANLDYLRNVAGADSAPETRRQAAKEAIVFLEKWRSGSARRAVDVHCEVQNISAIDELIGRKVKQTITTVGHMAALESGISTIVSNFSSDNPLERLNALTLAEQTYYFNQAQPSGLSDLPSPSRSEISITGEAEGSGKRYVRRAGSKFSLINEARAFRYYRRIARHLPFGGEFVNVPEVVGVVRAVDTRHALWREFVEGYRLLDDLRVGVSDLKELRRHEREKIEVGEDHPLHGQTVDSKRCELRKKVAKALLQAAYLSECGPVSLADPLGQGDARRYYSQALRNKVIAPLAEYLKGSNGDAKAFENHSDNLVVAMDEVHEFLVASRRQAVHTDRYPGNSVRTNEGDLYAYDLFSLVIGPEFMDEATFSYAGYPRFTKRTAKDEQDIAVLGLLGRRSAAIEFHQHLIVPFERDPRRFMLEQIVADLEASSGDGKRLTESFRQHAARRFSETEDVIEGLNRAVQDIRDGGAVPMEVKAIRRYADDLMVLSMNLTDDFRNRDPYFDGRLDDMTGFMRSVLDRVAGQNIRKPDWMRSYEYKSRLAAAMRLVDANYMVRQGIVGVSNVRYQLDGDESDPDAQKLLLQESIGTFGGIQRAARRLTKRGKGMKGVVLRKEFAEKAIAAWQFYHGKLTRFLDREYK